MQAFEEKLIEIIKEINKYSWKNIGRKIFEIIK